MMTPRFLPLLLLPLHLSAQIPDWKPAEKPWDRSLGSHRLAGGQPGELCEMQLRGLHLSQ